MAVLLVLAALAGVVLLVLSGFGVHMVLAGRQLDSATNSPGDRTHAPLAAGLDRRLHRTRVLVEELIMPEVDPEALRPSTTPAQERARTYVVLGVAILGVAASMVVGMLLLI